MILNVLATNIITESMLILSYAIALSIVYRFNATLNFALVIPFFVGGYVYISSITLFDDRVVISLLVTLLITAIIGGIIDFLVFLKLSRTSGSNTPIMAASMGVYFISLALVQVFWGAEIRSITLGPSSSINLKIFSITERQLFVFAINSIVAVTLIFLIWFTRFGLTLRAIGQNYRLAESIVLNPDRMRLIAVCIAYGAIGVLGAGQATEFGVSPYAGLSAFFVAAVVLLLSGVSSLPRIVISSIILASLNNFSLLFLSGEWQIAITFFILLLFTYFKSTKFNFPT